MLNDDSSIKLERLRRILGQEKYEELKVELERTKKIFGGGFSKGIDSEPLTQEEELELNKCLEAGNWSAVGRILAPPGMNENSVSQFGMSRFAKLAFRCLKNPKK